MEFNQQDNIGMEEAFKNVLPTLLKVRNITFIKYRSVLNIDDIQSIGHTSFLEAYSKYDSEKGSFDKFFSYVYNLRVLDMYKSFFGKKKKGLRQSTITDVESNIQAGELSLTEAIYDHNAPEPITIIITTETIRNRKKIWEFIANYTTDKQYEVLYSLYVEGLILEDVGKKLKIAPDSAGARRNNALSTLRCVCGLRELLGGES